jgi:ferredoxin
MIEVSTVCPQNHRCPLVRLCPKGAISQDGNGLPKVDDSKCTECGICVRNCVYGAFSKKQ